MIVARPPVKALACGLFALSLLSACSRPEVTHGNLPKDYELDAIQVGQTRRGEVGSLLGSPSTVSSFQDRTWYYIGQRQKRLAFLDPDVLERRVLVVHFDNQGIVTETDSYRLEDGQSVELVDRTTPTEGNEFSLLQQLLGNLGRFSGVEDNSGAQQRGF